MINRNNTTLDCRKNNVINVCLLCIIFVLFPFLATLLALYFLCYKRYVKIGVIVVISFFGLVGYTFLPTNTMDITRYNLTFEALRNVDTFVDFIFYQSLSKNPDFILDFVFWGLGKWINTHQIVGLLGAVCYYGLGLMTLLNWREQLQTRSPFNNFILPILMFLALAQVTEFSGMRQGNAILLFLFIITIPDMRLSAYKKCICLIFPCLLHFSMYPIVLFYVCTCFLRRRILLTISLSLSVSFGCFSSLMASLMNILNSFGWIGAGLALKIDSYMFEGEIQAALYSGSGLRFYVILLMMFVFPFIAFGVDKKRNQIPQFILRLHYWGILFFSYILLTCSSYILSRNIMLFKMYGILYFTFALFSCHLGRYTRQLIFSLCLLVILSGPLSNWLAKEYRVLNPELFYSNVVHLLSITTRLEGY